MLCQSIQQGFKLVALDFEMVNGYPKIDFLKKSLPSDLGPELSKSIHINNLVDAGERDRLLSEYEYIYDRIIIFDTSTIVKLQRQIGANSVVLGKITSEQGKKIRVDAAIVSLEKGVKIIEKYLIEDESDFIDLKHRAKLVSKLGKQIRLEVDREAIYSKKSKWALRLSIIPLLACGITGWQAYENQQSYLDATNIPDLNKYKTRRNIYTKAFYTTALASGISLTLHFKYKAKRIQRNKYLIN